MTGIRSCQASVSLLISNTFTDSADKCESNILHPERRKPERQKIRYDIDILLKKISIYYFKYLITVLCKNNKMLMTFCVAYM